MAAITREPYERVYMTRVFPEGDGSCRFELFVQRVVEIDGEDFYAKKAVVIKTKRLEDLAGVELAAGVSADEIWGMVKEMSGEKLSVFTIRSPKAQPYVIEVVNEVPADGKDGEATMTVSESKYDDVKTAPMTVGEKVVTFEQAMDGLVEIARSK
jgi:hypothetical protein